MKPVIVEEEAERELSAAYAFYEREVPGLGDAFLDVIDDQLGRIAASPGAFALAPRVARKLSVRRAVVRRFPFVVVFMELSAEIRVLAFAHQSRRPTYWRTRVRRRL